MCRCKLLLIIALLFQENSWEWLIQICQPILLALESRGVFLKKAGFVVECSVRVLYNFKNLFLQAFQAKNGAKELRLKSGYASKMENPIPILRQENIQEVLCGRFP